LSKTKSSTKAGGCASQEFEAEEQPPKNVIMSQIAPAEYFISLCNLAQESQESFGIAIRIGASNSKFNVEATKVIHSILTFSPAPDTVAVEFLNELEKVEGMEFLGQGRFVFLQGFADFEREQSHQSGVVCLSLTARPGLKQL
jgi:hypothetical protein